MNANLTALRRPKVPGKQRRLVSLLLTALLLWTLPGCGNNASAPEFPPTEEQVQTAAEAIGWTLDPEETQSWEDGHMLYALETDDGKTVSFSCAAAEDQRFLTASCAVSGLPDKPQFAWADWEKTVMLAEQLYGGFSEGEVYQALSQQEMPEPKLPDAGLPAGQESLSWEAELPNGYGKVRWTIAGSAVEQEFLSSDIKEWHMTFSLSLYASREAFEQMIADAAPKG